MTDWSFQQQELLDYGTASNDLEIPDDCVVEEVTHIYATQQRMHHFSVETMKIKAEDIHKCVFMVQHEVAWYTEQLYEFTMNTRTNKAILRDFINKFEAYNLKNNDNIKQEVKWLIDCSKEIKYKPSDYSQ